MNIAILPPQNTDWGFFGAISPHSAAHDAWVLAMETIGAATGCPDTAVRAFLDSRHGRHFADDVANGLRDGLALKAAIIAAAERWMGWRIDPKTSRRTNIPCGLPYLTGFVTDFEILAEAADSL